MSALVYGIDFGTSNSSIMVGTAEGGLVRVTDPVSGQSAIPTTVGLAPDGRLLVGAAADRTKAQRPADYRRNFKRDIGSQTGQPLGERAYTPRELAARVLEFLREQAEKAVPGRPDRVVITVPVTWERSRRDEILKAAVEAGFPRKLVKLESEPVAAVRATFADALQGPGTVLVYDLGGGTFDCAVAERQPDGRFEVLAKGGTETVGGADFTDSVVRLLRERFTGPVAEVLDGPAADEDVLRRRHQLLDTCETAKIRLSHTTRHEALLAELREPVELTLERADLEERVRPALLGTLSVCESVLAEAGMTWEDLDRVVPVGGASRMPLVGAMLAERCGDVAAVQIVDEPELAVVRGAVLTARRQMEAREAARLAKEEEKTRKEAEERAREEAAAERKRRERNERLEAKRREERQAEARAAAASAPSAVFKPPTTSSSSSMSETGKMALIGAGLGLIVGGIAAGITNAPFLIVIGVIGGAIYFGINANG
ncbi:Hsp70 family protein [Streptomyces sp. NPDC096339]|uniref:Hsp70 family protein n=1 Tax=Streptomyces sp. NPDC096339 TaxID=3366086 RepID=UPI00382BFEBD